MLNRDNFNILIGLQYDKKDSILRNWKVFIYSMLEVYMYCIDNHL